MKDAFDEIKGINGGRSKSLCSRSIQKLTDRDPGKAQTSYTLPALSAIRSYSLSHMQVRSSLGKQQALSDRQRMMRYYSEASPSLSKRTPVTPNKPQWKTPNKVLKRTPRQQQRPANYQSDGLRPQFRLGDLLRSPIFESRVKHEHWVNATDYKSQFVEARQEEL